MATRKKLTPRQRKLERIMTAIATLIVSDTYTDEAHVQGDLARALQLMEGASAQMGERE